MRGQWIGKYTGSNTGDFILEIDELAEHFEGRAYLYSEDQSHPAISGWIKTSDKSTEFELEVPLLIIHPTNGELVPWPQVASSYPGITVPTKSITEWECNDEEISVRWKTDIGTEGSAHLVKCNANRPSNITPISVETWDAFRKGFLELTPDRFIYRGQSSNKWRLQTSFHRTQRSDLLRYLQVDVPALHGQLSSLTTHYFNLQDAIQNGAFMNLIQHHGYPTPLLDWTHSPFIAAFFAYRNVRPSQSAKQDKVRIFIFDSAGWRAKWNQLQRVTPARPHFSLFAPIALNNTRMVPQQAVSSVTNMEDIEEYVRSKATPENSFLQAVDLPVSERTKVLQELSTMGITSGSLFPGLDGTCEAMKERMFGFE